RAASGERGHEADHRSGAGHVPLHVLHAAGRLDADAAGVEGDALADEGEWLSLALLRVARGALPLHHHDAWFVDTALRDAEQRAEAQFLQFVRPEHLDIDTELAQALAASRHLGGVED